MSIHIQHSEPGGAVDDQAALEQFQKQWTTYQKLADHDSIAQNETAALLHDALKALTKPFDFLDIACGDAGQMKRALEDTKISHYRGIDLSEPALELAAKNLAGVPFAVDLDHRDFVEALTKRPERVDIAWCSLSLHHLSTDGKRNLLTAICGTIRDFFMLYEPTLAEGEDREAFLERFRRVNRPAWPFLTSEEWDQVDQHVTTCDFPETDATWCALGRDAGFSQARQIYLDPTGFYGLYRYDR
jgi:hypothetical protein